MDKLFKNKYKTSTSRLEGFDYSQQGVYFVTICTKGMKEFFGKVENGEMALNSFGKIVNQFWNEIPQHFSFVKLYENIIMPNHLHGIIEICKNKNEVMPRIYRGKYPEMSARSPKSGSLSVIIGGYKSIVTKMANRNFCQLNFAWQPNFYDHIVRNEKSLNEIRQYIIENPVKWEMDRNNPENIWI